MINMNTMVYLLETLHLHCKLLLMMQPINVSHTVRKLEFAIFIYPFITLFSSVFDVRNTKMNKLWRVCKGYSQETCTKTLLEAIQTTAINRSDSSAFFSYLSISLTLNLANPVVR